MFSLEENELLTRVGPRTAMGNLMRRYWIPALLSEEIPLPDCPPVRVRLLGENRVDYCLLDTRMPLDTALVRYLSRRDRLTR